MKLPKAVCPDCSDERELSDVLTAQANQNVIYQCAKCGYIVRNIQTSKG
ncbi:hypothetical protein LRR81_14590 [Metabacillus sp. GX 13764]|nr:hypothetical protein [Metabacillus kandeliae]MCD7035470.1 hypothetical protein [Metabacillus kandeliae]